MLLNPLRELFAAELTACNSQDNSLLLVNGGGQLVTVQDEHCFERRMANSFVAVEERMILNEEVPERRGFFRQGWVKLPGRQTIAVAAEQMTLGCHDLERRTCRLSAG